jgi:hypothetical protein
MTMITATRLPAPLRKLFEMASSEYWQPHGPTRPARAIDRRRPGGGEILVAYRLQDRNIIKNMRVHNNHRGSNWNFGGQ